MESYEDFDAPRVIIRTEITKELVRRQSIYTMKTIISSQPVAESEWGESHTLSTWSYQSELRLASGSQTTRP